MNISSAPGQWQSVTKRRARSSGVWLIATP
jgi:hypothetical protein